MRSARIANNLVLDILLPAIKGSCGRRSSLAKRLALRTNSAGSLHSVYNETSALSTIYPKSFLIQSQSATAPVPLPARIIPCQEAVDVIGELFPRDRYLACSFNLQSEI